MLWDTPQPKKKKKKKKVLPVLWYLLHHSGLKPNLQYLWGMPVLVYLLEKGEWGLTEKKDNKLVTEIGVPQLWAQESQVLVTTSKT